MYSRVIFILVMQSWILSIITPAFSVTWSFRNDCNIQIFLLSMLTTVCKCNTEMFRTDSSRESSWKTLFRRKSSSVNVKTQNKSREQLLQRALWMCAPVSLIHVLPVDQGAVSLLSTSLHRMRWQSAYSYIPSKASRLKTKDPSRLPGRRASLS